MSLPFRLLICAPMPGKVSERPATMSIMTSSRLRVASDVGGTFTDNLAYDAAEKRITVAKVPTTPENRALGTMRGLRRALEAQGRGGGDVAYVGHGMTTATNALLT